MFSDDMAAHTLKVPAGHTVMVYVYEGEAALGEDGTVIRRGQVARLDREGDTVTVTPQAADTRLVVLAGKPLQEPIVQYGPFVMNTRQEIEQALSDYQRGELAKTF